MLYKRVGPIGFLQPASQTVRVPRPTAQHSIAHTAFQPWYCNKIAHKTRVDMRFPWHLCNATADAVARGSTCLPQSQPQSQPQSESQLQSPPVCHAPLVLQMRFGERGKNKRAAKVNSPRSDFVFAHSATRINYTQQQQQPQQLATATIATTTSAQFQYGQRHKIIGLTFRAMGNAPEKRTVQRT